MQPRSAPAISRAAATHSSARPPAPPSASESPLTAPPPHLPEFPSPSRDGSNTPSATPAPPASAPRRTAPRKPRAVHALLLLPLRAKPVLLATAAIAPQPCGDPGAIAPRVAAVHDRNLRSSD